MKVKMQIEGGHELAKALRSLAGEIEAGLGEVVTTTATELRENVTARYLSGSPPSQPGESPAPVTGTLAASTGQRSTGPLSAEVFNTADHALHLELGTQRMAPRPAWIPAREQIAPTFRARAATAIGRVLK